MKLLSSINENTDIVDKKYVDDAVSDVQEQVSATKYWANVAVSATSSNTTKPKFSPDFEFNVAANTVIGSAANKAIASPLARYLWHDIISFGANGHPTVSISADGGSTWTTSTDVNLQKKLFIQREDQTITVLDDSKTAIRWDWYSSNFHACQASFLNIGFAYSAKGATFNILWETSTDGSTWTTGFTVTGAKYGSAPYWFYITTNWSNAYWARLTITRTSGAGTSTNLSGIKLLTTRWGNQGRGSEWEVPYVWDYAQNIYPRVSDAATLGTSSYKWSNVYATKFTGALDGNAATATTATNLADAPSLSADGNNIKVTAGGKTSSAFTVPYATSAGSATSATTATNLTSAPSLTANGDKIKVTIGDKSSSELTVPYATKAKGDASGNDIASTYAPNASPTFTGTPKAPTAASGTNTTQIATTAFVIGEINSKLAASDAMQFKGTLGTGGTITALPASHSKGDTYKVITAGTYAGIACEVGDMIICITDGTSANNAHWTVVQSNIDGAVTGPTSAVSGNVAIFNGTTGRVIKDSGIASSSIYQKTTYEWNNEISFGSSGKLCVGKFVMYDSAVVVEINATTNTTYHAILVIATQNHGTSSGGNIKATVYGDATNTITPNIKIYSHPANDGLVEVYFSPTGYSKNLVHIQAQGLSNRGTVSYSELAFDICTSVASIPSTATLVPTNALTENFASKSVATTSSNGLMSAADKAKLDSKITIAGNQIGLGETIAVDTLQSSLGLGSLAYMSALSTGSKITLTGTTAETALIQFSRTSYNYITFPSTGYLAFGTSASGAGITARVAANDFSPYTDGTKSLGTETLRWGAVYAKEYYGEFKGTLPSHNHSYLPLAGGTMDDGATIKLSLYGNRFLTISGNSIMADMSSTTGGWAGAFASVKDPTGTETTMLGWYGGTSGLTHIFMGGTYSDPAMKMNSSGEFTFKKTIKGSINGNAGTATKLSAAKNIELIGDVTGSVDFDGSSDVDITTTVKRTVGYGICETAAATSAKVITIADTSWTLEVGSIIGVKSSVSNSASNVTLNVNGSGAKEIYYNNAKYTSTSSSVCGYKNRTIYYMYDGTYWVWLSMGTLSDANTVPSVQCETAAGTAAKVGTCTNFSLLAKSYVYVNIRYTNTSAGAITLNINSTGAKPIYINGTASSSSNYGLSAGSYLAYYDGTNFYFRTDGVLTASITGKAGDSDKLGGRAASDYALSSSFGSYLPLSGGTLTGTTSIKTNAGSAPLVIMRNAATEATSIYQSDTGLHFDVVNDEKTANISIKLKATDTENSTGVDAGEATVTISGSKSGSSITATTFSGNATTATTASKLSTVSKTAWGQTFWTSDGVPTSISGDMTGVGSISASGDIATSNGLFKSTKNGNTLTIGSQNATWCHFANSADVKFHFNKEVHSAGGFKIYNTSHGLSSTGALTAATGSFTSTLAVTSTSTFTGKTTHNGGLLVAAGKSLELGTSKIVYNSANGCLEITA